MIKRILYCTLLFCCLSWSMASCRTSLTHRSTVQTTELTPQEVDSTQITSGLVDQITQIRTYGDGQKRILDLVFHPSGEFFATSGEDLTIRVWDTSSGQELQTFPMHLVDMADIDISPDGSLLASGEAIWDLDSGQEIYTLERGSPHPAFVAFNPTGSHLAVARLDQGVMLWDTSSGEVTQSYQIGEEQRTKRMEFSPDGSRLAAGVIDGTIRIWDTETGEINQTLHYSGETDIHDLAYSPDGKYLASTGRIPRSILWDVVSGEVLETFPMADNGLRISFSPDSTLVAVTGGGEKAVLIYDVSSGQRIRILEMGEQSLALNFSPDGHYLAAGTYDGRIILWGISTEP